MRRSSSSAGTGQFHEDNPPARRPDRVQRVLNKTFANGAFRIERENERDAAARRFGKCRQPNLFPEENERLAAERKSEVTRSTVK